MKTWRYILGFLTLITITTWLAVLNYPDKKLHLIVCDVGQGDAILAVYGKTQILVDGGPGSSVLDCLASYMPFWDREIELIVMTHPQLDHFEGLIEVFRRYQVDKLLANSIDSGSQAYNLLKSQEERGSTDVIYPDSGMVISIGLIHLDIVHPSKRFVAENTTPKIDVNEEKILGATTTKLDPNDFSIVAILSYGDFDALLTGDIGPHAMNDVLTTGRVRDVEYIKIPHHGSKNGLTKSLLDASNPEIAVISVGKNNRFGHPNIETLDMLDEEGIPILRTDEVGDIEVTTDGENWWIGN